MMTLRSTVLLVDSVGALLAGVCVVSFAPFLSELEQLPFELLLTSGITNLVYGSYSGLLFMSNRRRASLSQSWLRLLVAANAGWAVLCVAIGLATWNSASMFGSLHWLGEGTYVGTLAVLEGRLFATVAVKR